MGYQRRVHGDSLLVTRGRNTKMMKTIAIVLLAAVAFAEPEAQPKAEADPYLLYGGYYGHGLGYGGYGYRGLGYHGLGYRGYGKRSADADADPYLLYGHGYGYGHLGYAGHYGYPYGGYSYLG